MQPHVVAAIPRSLMVELIDLLGDFSPERSRRQSEVLAARLAELERRARLQEAAPETVAAIQGARVLLDLAELPPLPPSSTNA